MILQSVQCYIGGGDLKVAVREKKRLGDILVQSGGITLEQKKSILNRIKTTNERFGEAIIALGILTEEEIIATLARQLEIGVLDLEGIEPDKKLLKLVPESMARKHLLVPLRRNGNSIEIAMTDPLNIPAIDELSAKLNGEISVFISLKSHIEKFIYKHYGISGSVHEAITSIDTSLPDTITSHLSNSITPTVTAGMAPIASLLETIISQAVDERASDIHLEPCENSLHIRNRIDGILFPIGEIPKKLQSHLISRVKVVSRLDISETRIPQDGRFMLPINGRQVELRVSTFPTIYGENVVIRVLRKDETLTALEQTGLDGTSLEKTKKLIKTPHGILIVTGPTGSGKTTTLYSILNELNSVDRNIVTIEDPVEYRLPGVRQSQINLKTGLDFANSLRSILRQDPDIIMVGEIRDRSTAEIAIQAAMTGHMVLTTLHTNDSASAIVRLMDLGIEPYLISSSISGVIGQRLVRKICGKCKTKTSGHNVENFSLRDKTASTYYGRGCLACNKSGYAGRTGIFEVLMMDDVLNEKITRRAGVAEIRKFLLEDQKMETMKMDGMQKAKSGITTDKEISRVISDI